MMKIQIVDIEIFLITLNLYKLLTEKYNFVEVIRNSFKKRY